MKYGGLITVGLKAFNQRSYLGAALDGVLAQSYRPLEIVISDDGSTDGSWELIQERVRSFESQRNREDPSLRIVLNRNERNLGNMGNWLKICELSHGEWVVKCDGDDISAADRVEVLARTLDGCDGGVRVVTCGGTKISPEGRVVGRFAARSAEYPLGACMAFHRDCFSSFPIPDDGQMVDDEVFARRALMLGSEVRIDRPLVRYRVGTGISSGRLSPREPELRCMRKMSACFRQSRLDADTLDSTRRARWLSRLAVQEQTCEWGIRLRSAPTFAARWQAYRQVERPAGLSLYKIKLWAYLLPPSVGDRLLALLARLRYWIKL